MERPTVMKTFAGNLSHEQPALSIADQSPPFVLFSQNKAAAARDASVCSDLKPQQINDRVDDSEISIFDAKKYFDENCGSDPRVCKRISPVNVINLESAPRFSSASSSVDGFGRNYRAHSFHATPTASSEASWNSQTGLLSNPPGAIAVSVRNPDEKKKGSAKKWLLGRKCPCAGKKSVQVEAKLSERRTQSPRVVIHKSNQSHNTERKTPHFIDKSSASADWLQRQEVVHNSHRISADGNRFPSVLSQHHHRTATSSARPFTDTTISGFSFPILSQTSSPPPIKLVLNGTTNYNPPLEDPRRDSLEVFRPADDPLPTSKTPMELHQCRSFTFPGSPKSRMTITDDDIASDASSDLFEIESFSTQTTCPMYINNNNNHGRRDSLDEATTFSARRLCGNMGGVNLYSRQSIDEPMTPSIAPTECYEPSEASIDWSVTTAEGFDRGSVTNFSVSASEADLHHHHEMMDMHRRETERSGGGGKRRGGSGGSLLSCRSEKGVSVGPQPVKYEGQRHVHVSNSRPPIAIRAPLARSHSVRLSMPFAT